jgi:hypothetical protein
VRATTLFPRPENREEAVWHLSWAAPPRRALSVSPDSRKLPIRELSRGPNESLDRPASERLEQRAQVLWSSCFRCAGRAVACVRVPRLVAVPSA